MHRLLSFAFAALSLAVAAAVLFPSTATGVLAVCGTAAAACISLQQAHADGRRIDILESTLDAMPQPVTVTDLEMRWLFINKTTEGLLKRSRGQVRGRHCSEWQAHICNTGKCGVISLRGGRPRTSYVHNMADGTKRTMQVDTSYITNRQGQRIGHVEILTDVQAQEELSGVYSNLAASLEEMTSTMTEIDSQTRANAANAAQARALAAESRQRVQGGIGEMRQLNEAMDAITGSSREITKINKAIDEIAFQTNILALNAAVEAARAGDAGTGFAVVAGEVRNLASRASDAARRAGEVIERSSAAVDQGSTLAHKVIDTLSAMGSGAQKVDEVIQQIAGASAEQAQGISAVTQTLANLEQIASQSAGGWASAPLVQIQQ
jgi:methyl-accepting chemotaxis protein